MLLITALCLVQACCTEYSRSVYCVFSSLCIIIDKVEKAVYYNNTEIKLYTPTHLSMKNAYNIVGKLCKMYKI